MINHAGRGYGTEALKLVGEGVTDPFTVDRIMREQVNFGGAGFKLGPFELLDLTGLDVSHPVMESIYRQFYDEPRFRPSALAAQRVAGGLLGRKTGEGFYRQKPPPPRWPVRRLSRESGWRPAHSDRPFASWWLRSVHHSTITIRLVPTVWC